MLCPWLRMDTLTQNWFRNVLQEAAHSPLPQYRRALINLPVDVTFKPWRYSTKKIQDDIPQREILALLKRKVDYPLTWRVPEFPFHCSESQTVHVSISCFYSHKTLPLAAFFLSLMCMDHFSCIWSVLTLGVERQWHSFHSWNISRLLFRQKRRGKLFFRWGECKYCPGWYIAGSVQAGIWYTLKKYQSQMAVLLVVLWIYMNKV